MHRLVLATAVVVALLGCGSDATKATLDASASADGAAGGPPKGEADPQLIAYLKDTWGVSLTNYTGFEENYKDLGNGEWMTTFTGETTIEGLGTRSLTIEEIVAPIGAGLDISLFVKDDESGVERYFQYNAAENYVTIGSLESSAAVSANADGSYDVWSYKASRRGDKDNFKTVANGFEALKEVEAMSGFKDLPPHLLMTGIALAHTSVPEGRFVVACGMSNTAATPAVCTLFKEFCDCAACLALSKQGACAACPKL